MESDTTTRTDLAQLIRLNRDYVDSVQHGDVRRFQEILAEDFLCSNPDGSLVDKRQFLQQTAQPVSISGLTAEDVRVRILGDVAIIHARTSYTTASGQQRSGRYTDVWARRDAAWLAVSAHVTRYAAAFTPRTLGGPIRALAGRVLGVVGRHRRCGRRHGQQGDRYRATGARGESLRLRRLAGTSERRSDHGGVQRARTVDRTVGRNLYGSSNVRTNNRLPIGSSATAATD